MKCNRLEGLLDILNNKFQLQHKTIKSLQYCKLCRQAGKIAEEWVGRLRIAVGECNYKELHRKLKEQFIHGLNDDEMLTELIHKLTAIKSTSIVTSEQY